MIRPGAFLPNQAASVTQEASLAGNGEARRTNRPSGGRPLAALGSSQNLHALGARVRTLRQMTSTIQGPTKNKVCGTGSLHTAHRTFNLLRKIRIRTVSCILCAPPQGNSSDGDHHDCGVGTADHAFVQDHLESCTPLLALTSGASIPLPRNDSAGRWRSWQDVAMTTLSARFDEALLFARQRHQGQFRKGTEIPYVAHLLSTAALVLEGGGDEEQAIAGLLHDALEDNEFTEVTFEELVKEFGERVANMVRDCSDSEPGKKKRGWKARKKRYLAALKTHDKDSLLVANADKLHNARAILTDYRTEGEDLWSRFSKKSDPLWYYPRLAKIFRKRRTPLADEFDLVVKELVALVKRERRTLR